jgi:predicted MFS family arabinose efflux permease
MTSAAKRRSHWGVPAGGITEAAFWWNLLVTAAFFLSYNALLVLVPLFVHTQKGSTTSQGLATLSLMAAATVGPIAASRLSRAVRLDVLMTASIALLCLPIPLYFVLRTSLGATALSLVRGFGFGAGCVVSATLSAHLAVRRPLGSAMAWYGTATAIVTVPAQAGSIWLAGVIGFQATFLVAGALSLATIPAMLVLIGPRHRALGYLPTRGQQDALAPHNRASERPRLVALAGAFLFATAIYGSVVTFLPGHLTAVESKGMATLYFVVMGTALPVGRLFVARWLDHHPALVQVLGVLVMLVGSLLLAVPTSIGSVIAAGTCFGLGFGAFCTFTLFGLTDLVQPSHYRVANTYFAGSFNLGIGVGAIAFGVGLSHFSYDALDVIAVLACVVGVLVTFPVRRRASTLPVASAAATPAQ